MTPQDAAQLLFNEANQGRRYPLDAAALSLDAGYQAQLALIQLFLDAGETQGGWKIGFTAPAVRERFGATAPVFGYLLDRTALASGGTQSLAGLTNPCLESELCFEFGSTLPSSGVTAELVRESLSAVIPAFELIDLCANPKEHPGLNVADNVMHVSWVLGAPLRPYPKALDLGSVQAAINRDGELFQQHLGRDVIDNQLESLAWLANAVGRFGGRIEAGHKVLTGSFGAPIPVKSGEHFETEFSDIGNVSVQFT